MHLLPRCLDLTQQILKARVRVQRAERPAPRQVRVVHEAAPRGVLEPLERLFMRAGNGIALGDEPRPVLDVPGTPREVLTDAGERFGSLALQRKLQAQASAPRDGRDLLDRRRLEYRSRI